MQSGDPAALPASAPPCDPNPSGSEGDSGAAAWTERLWARRVAGMGRLLDTLRLENAGLREALLSRQHTDGADVRGPDGGVDGTCFEPMHDDSQQQQQQQKQEQQAQQSREQQFEAGQDPHEPHQRMWLVFRAAFVNFEYQSLLFIPL
jgi:hypothetical protein